ncbi:hypothetical protein ABIB40_000787 [Pedobacter sp. UYP30]
MWKARDVGLTGFKMIGYCSENCPVKTNNPNALVIGYQKKGKAMIALATWADSDISVNLCMDWSKLGIEVAKATIAGPKINKF